MRDRLNHARVAAAVVAAGVSAVGCTMIEERAKSPIRVVLDAPKHVERTVLIGTKPPPSFDALQVSVRFENVGETPVHAPLDEIGSGLVVTYRVDGKIYEDTVPPPPPPQDGTQKLLAPGETHIVRLTFAPPEECLGEGDTVKTIDVCVTWQPDWLRASNYAVGSVTWNPTIQLCRPTRVQP